jgi:hypothetical protein
MKHNIIISVGLLSGAFFLSQSNTAGQEANLFVVRYIEVDRANAKEFEKAVAEKTKKFNRSEDSDPWFTHKIVTGPRTRLGRIWIIRSQPIELPSVQPPITRKLFIGRKTSSHLKRKLEIMKFGWLYLVPVSATSQKINLQSMQRVTGGK